MTSTRGSYCRAATCYSKTLEEAEYAECSRMRPTRRPGVGVGDPRVVPGLYETGELNTLAGGDVAEIRAYITETIQQTLDFSGV